MSDDSATGPFNVTPLLRKSAAERVVTQVIGLIRSGNVKPGDRIPTESELASAFQVSKPVVREALRALAILGVVETRQGGRCFVTDLTVARLMAPLQFVISLDEASVDALHEARLMTEVGIVRRAALRTDEAVLARLGEMVDAGSELVRDPVGFRMLDQEFHRTINHLGGNPFLEVVAQSFYELGMDTAGWRPRTGLCSSGVRSSTGLSWRRSGRRAPTKRRQQCVRISRASTN